MSGSHVEVLPVPEGSIVVIRNVDLDGPEGWVYLLEEMRKAVGHDRWVVLQISEPGDVWVVGPDVDLKAVVGQLLAEARFPS